MKGPHRWKALWIVGTISLHGEAGSTVSVAASRQPSSEQRGAVGNVVTTGASEVKSHRRRGKKTPAPHSRTKHVPRWGTRSDVDSPKRVWRRETLHILEGRAPRCPNTARQARKAGQLVTGNDTPLETHEMRVHVTAVTVGRHWSVSSRFASQKRRGSKPEGNARAPWTVRTRGERVKKVSGPIPSSQSRRSRLLRGSGKTKLRGRDTVERAQVLHGCCSKRVRVA